MSSPLSPSVRSLLREHIDSVGAVELLMLLESDPSRVWTIDDLCATLKCPPSWPPIQLQAMSAAGLVEEADKAWRFAPVNEARRRAVAALVAAYRIDSSAIARFIFASEPSTVRAAPAEPDRPQTERQSTRRPRRRHGCGEHVASAPRRRQRSAHMRLWEALPMAAGQPTRQRDITPLRRTSTRSAIVCGVDRSAHARAAARLAILLARRLRRPLELVHVVEPRSMPSSEGGMTAVQAVLEEELDMDGIGVRLQSGSVVSVLAHAARRSSLLVIGGRGEGAVRRALLGSVSGALTSNPPCPVVVVPPAAAAASAGLVGRAIICAVRDESDAPAAHVAGKLASALGHTLALAHVIAPTAARARGNGRPRTTLVQPTPTTEREAAFHMLGQIARPISANLACDIELHVLDGAAGPQLDRLAAVEHASMLAVGASQRGALAAALAGEPSGHLMRHGERPVMICPSVRHAGSVREGSAMPGLGAFSWQAHR